MKTGKLIPHPIVLHRSPLVALPETVSGRTSSGSDTFDSALYTFARQRLTSKWVLGNCRPFAVLRPFTTWADGRFSVYEKFWNENCRVKLLYAFSSVFRDEGTH